MDMAIAQKAMRLLGDYKSLDTGNTKTEYKIEDSNLSGDGGLRSLKK